MKNKDTIYIDVEDEITGIIDKVRSSKSGIVALVLPKRASVFQSVVNMRLLKRKADDSKKKIVLVTSEESILPLAGVAGIHVAKTLQSEPSIPPIPSRTESPIKINEGSIDHDDVEEVTGDLDKTKPVGVLAGLSPIPIPTAKPEDDTIEVDNDPEDETADKEDKPSKKNKDKKDKKDKDNKSPKVPNFERFRLALILGAIGLIALIVLWYIGFKVLPTANVIIETKTSSINSDLTVTLSSTATAVDPVNMVIPAKIVSMKATATSPSVTTTGQKSIGTEATGTITITNDNYPNAVDVPAGTVFTDNSGNYSFTTNIDTTIAGCTVSLNNGKCRQPTTDAIAVTATQVGASYNLNPTSYSSPDFDYFSASPDSIQGGQMSGGSSSVVQVVAQADINNAQAETTAPNTSSAKTQLEQQLEQAGLKPVVASFSAGTPSYSPSAAVGAQANTITVTENITDTMYGVSTSNISTLITNNVNQQINSASQSILDTGVSGATFGSESSTSATTVQATLNANSTVGPKINISGLPKQLVGLKSGQIENQINAIPGVTNVSVKYSPFWVTATPHKASKIKITVEKSNGSTP
jgi:hypothetical protein